VYAPSFCAYDFAMLLPRPNGLSNGVLAVKASLYLISNATYGKARVTRRKSIELYRCEMIFGHTRY
jgi:hypothetical protein